MSLSATGGGDSSGALASAMLQILRSAKFTSAGGDSPKENTYIPGSVDGADFGSILDDAVRVAVLRHMEDNGMLDGVLDTGGVPNEGSLTEGQAVGLARSGLSTLQNPAGLVEVGLGKLPHAVLVGFAISLIPIIIEELTKPGGPFDLRFKRIVEKEFNSLMDRQTAHDIAIGERGIIIQSRQGFINRNGALTNTNTLRTIREGGINKRVLNEVDYLDHSEGLF